MTSVEEHQPVIMEMVDPVSNSDNESSHSVVVTWCISTNTSSKRRRKVDSQKLHDTPTSTRVSSYQQRKGDQRRESLTFDLAIIIKSLYLHRYNGTKILVMCLTFFVLEGRNWLTSAGQQIVCLQQQQDQQQPLLAPVQNKFTICN